MHSSGTSATLTGMWLASASEKTCRSTAGMAGGRDRQPVGGDLAPAVLALVPADTVELLQLGDRFRGDDRDPCAALEQGPDLAQGDPATADDEHPGTVEVDVDREARRPGGDLAERGHRCSPHSVFSEPFHRPERASSPSITGSVHAQQPIDG